MNFSKLIFYVFFVSFLLSCKSTLPTGQVNELTSSYDENWEYFELDKTINAKIIFHLPAPALCGIMAFASVLLVQTQDGQVYRILDLCNNSNFTENDIVEITPSKKPEFNVLLPYRMYINPKTKKAEQFELDKKTLKTTYGNIEKK